MEQHEVHRITPPVSLPHQPLPYLRTDNISISHIYFSLHHTLSDFFGDGIFNSDGDAWKFHRKIASHVFTSRSIKNDMTSVFVKNARLMVDKLNKYADSGKQFDMQDLYFRYTLESFAEIAFGEKS